MHADTVKEEFLFCKPLLETTKAINVLKVMDRFFANHNFDWKKILDSLCTGGAPAMLGNTSGFAALVKKAPQVIVTHCFLHQHALASKTLPALLKEVLATSVKMSISSEQLLQTISFLRGFIKKWEQNMKFFTTQRFAGFPEDKS